MQLHFFLRRSEIGWVILFARALGPAAAPAFAVRSVFAVLVGFSYSYRRDLARIDQWLGQASVVDYRSSIQKGVIVDRQGSAYLLNSLTGVGHRVATGVWTAALSPDARIVATVLRSGSISVIDAGSGVTRFALDPTGNPLSLALSDDSRELAAGTAEGAIRIWSLTDGRLVTTAEPRLGPIHTLRFARRGLLITFS